jgi:hypothetical protein
VDFGHGMFPTRKVDDALGAPFDDKNECIVDDKCIPFSALQEEFYRWGNAGPGDTVYIKLV